MFTLGFIVGALVIGTIWYFWSKILTEEKALVAKFKSLEAADKVKVQAFLKRF